MNPALTTLAQAEAALHALGPLPFPLPLGDHAPAVAGAFLGMSRGDWAVVGPRERVGAALRGCPMERLVDPGEGARPYKIAPTAGPVGARALHAVGLALASGGPTLCVLGAASSANGSFYEGLNAAALTGANVLFVVLDRRIPAGAPIGAQHAADLLALGASLGLRAETVANEVEAVQAAVQRLRGGGPALLIVAVGAA